MKSQRKKYLPPEMYESWGGLFMPKRYEVLNVKTWVTAYRAVEVGKNGFLHYELYDGTNGLARSGTWREKGKQAGPLVPATVQPILSDDDFLIGSKVITKTLQFILGEDDILEIN